MHNKRFLCRGACAVHNMEKSMQVGQVVMLFANSRVRSDWLHATNWDKTVETVTSSYFSIHVLAKLLHVRYLFF